MKANELHSHLVNIQADERTKSALLAIIDQKVENDMEKILSKIEVAVQPLRSENQGIRSEISNVRGEMLSENQAIRSDIRNIKWTISIAIAITGILVALIVKYF